jgi:F-type H+-transporting ATPase subunit b
MPQLDVATYPAQLFWLFFSFFCFFCVVRWAIVPRLTATLKTREEKLSTLLAEARTLQREALQKEQHANAALKKTKQEMQEMLAHELTQLRDQLKAREDELQLLYTQKRAEAVQTLEETARAIVSEAQQDIVVLSKGAAEKLNQSPVLLSKRG